MKIACDIDGCLNLFTQRLKEVVQEKFDVLVEDNLNDYEILKLLNIELPEDKHKFWLKVQDEVDKCKNFPEASKYLRMLKKEGFHITLITARGYHIASRTEKWLDSRGYGGVYDEIIFNAGTKVDACKWKDINLMIEDLPKNIEALSNENIKVVVPKHAYNEFVEGENIYMCDNWHQIYNVIKKMK